MRENAGISARLHSFVVRLRCRFGWHTWVITRRTNRAELECAARNEVRAKYCGICHNGDYIVDRECEACGYRDYNINQETNAARVREERVWRRLQELDA